MLSLPKCSDAAFSCFLRLLLDRTPELCFSGDLADGRQEVFISMLVAMGTGAFVPPPFCLIPKFSAKWCSSGNTKFYGFFTVLGLFDSET